MIRFTTADLCDDNANIHSGHDSESSVEAHEILGAALSF